MDEKFLQTIDSYHEHLDDCKELIPDDQLICECHCVSALDIRRLFDDGQEVDLEVLKSHFGLGTACSSCIQSKEDWLKRL